MMQGIVNSNLSAVIEIRLQDKNGQEQIIEATIDTGFNGYLTLPSNIIENLASVGLGRNRARLADGTEAVFDIYEVTLQWDNQLKQVEVNVVDCTPLVGMALLENYQLQISVISGGAVSIISLP
ncbi:MAG: clan AA aspartic protease [Acidobacteria bacterium]|nr:clan AA aspartic protease [Acidobacteriota bacterium]